MEKGQEIDATSENMVANLFQCTLNMAREAATAKTMLHFNLLIKMKNIQTTCSSSITIYPLHSNPHMWRNEEKFNYESGVSGKLLDSASASLLAYISSLECISVFEAL